VNYIVNALRETDLDCIGLAVSEYGGLDFAFNNAGFERLFAKIAIPARSSAKLDGSGVVIVEVVQIPGSFATKARPAAEPLLSVDELSRKNKVSN